MFQTSRPEISSFDLLGCSPMGSMMYLVFELEVGPFTKRYAQYVDIFIFCTGILHTLMVVI